MIEPRYCPSRDSDDPEERKMGSWLQNRRTGKSGKFNVVFYDSDQAIAESYRLPELFDRIMAEAEEVMKATNAKFN